MDKRIFCAFLLILGLVLTEGCGSNLPSPPLAAGGATSAYVIQQTTYEQQVLAFPLRQSGKINPRASIEISHALQALAADSNGNVYIAEDSSEIAVYSSISNSSSAPVRTIPLPSGFGGVYSLVVDSSGQLYVAMETAILVYLQHPDGTVSLQQQITGNKTGIFIPRLLAVDNVGHIYVTSAETGALAIYAAGATGNVAPDRLITPPSGMGFGGIAVDDSGNIYAAEGKNNEPFAIVEFASGATGATSPLKTISAPSLGVGYIYGLQLDASGNLYAIDNRIDASGGGTPALLAFGPMASGQVTPSLNIGSFAWTSTNVNLAIQ